MKAIIKNLLISGLYLSVLSIKAQVCNSIVAAYDFNGNANDISGHGYNFSEFNASYVTDRFGNGNSAFQIRPNSYLEISTPDFPQINGPYTYSVWFKLDSSAVLHGGGIGPIWSYANIVDTCETKFELVGLPTMMGGTMTLDFWPACMDTTTVAGLGGGGVYPWKFIVVVNDGSEFKVYVDGISYISHLSLFPISNQTIFSIGKPSNFFLTGCDGSVDDLVIYNCALSASEVHLLNVGEQILQMVHLRSDLDRGLISIICGQEWLHSSLVIYDISGRVIFKTVLETTQFEIPVSNTNSGCYLISLQNNQNIYQNKFFVAH